MSKNHDLMPFDGNILGNAWNDVEDQERTRSGQHHEPGKEATDTQERPSSEWGGSSLAYAGNRVWTPEQLPLSRSEDNCTEIESFFSLHLLGRELSD